MAFYSLTPLFDLEVVKPLGNYMHYRTKVKDPGFTIELSSPLKKGWYEIKIHIERINGSIRFPQLFIDTGKGYNEIETIVLQRLINNTIYDVIILPESVRSIRFDPTMENAEFIIGNLELTPVSKIRASIKLFVLKNKTVQALRVYYRNIFKKGAETTNIDSITPISIYNDERIPEKYIGIIEGGKYEEVEINMIRKYGEDGDRFIIVGGCIDIVSCYTLKMFPKSILMSIEPNSILRSIGKRNILLNHLKSRYYSLKGIILHKKGKIDFNLSNAIDSSSIYDCPEKGKTIRVRSYTIAEAIDYFKKKFSILPNFLIIDAEGAENDILSNEESLRTISRIFPKLCVEFHPSLIGKEKCDELYNRIIDMGYTCLEKEPKYGVEFMFQK